MHQADRAIADDDGDRAGRDAQLGLAVHHAGQRLGHGRFLEGDFRGIFTRLRKG